MAKIPLERNQLRLGDAIKKFLKESGLDEKLQQHRVASHWDTVLEGKIAASTKYIRVKDGVVSVGLESAVARQELHMRKTEIIAALNEKMGIAYVKEIRVHWFNANSTSATVYTFLTALSTVQKGLLGVATGGNLKSW